MTTRRVLIVEDDPKTASSIKLYLEHNGFDTAIASDGLAGLEMARRLAPDILILDLMLPLMSGIEVCRALRAESNVPVIMLTARTTEEDKLGGLNIGADDYITKPFSPRELVARVRAVLRRAVKQASEDLRIKINNLVVDLERHEVEIGEKAVYLTPTEFKLLETFVKSPGRTFTRQELVERAFGWDYQGLDRTVDAHVMKLRKKLGVGRDQPSMIATVFGVGYKLSEKRDDS